MKLQSIFVIVLMFVKSQTSFASTPQEFIDHTLTLNAVEGIAGSIQITGRCTGIALDGSHILTARHCYPVWTASMTCISSTFTDPTCRYTQHPTATYIGNPSVPLQDMIHDHAVLSVQLSTTTAPISVFGSRNELLSFIRNALTNQTDVFLAGSTTGVFQGKLVSEYHDGRFIVATTGQAGDSGGPVWIGDKLVGTISTTTDSLPGPTRNGVLFVPFSAGN